MEKRGTIHAEGLTIGYRQERGRKKTVQENLGFTLAPGRLTCLLGPNGAGKSTLLRTLCGAQKPFGGTLEINGKSIRTMSEKELSRLVGVVLTDPVFAGGLTVHELVSLGRQPHSGFFGVLTEHDHQVVARALESAGVAHKADCYFAQLSDGERQKTLIAKVLAQESPVILLDEPTAFLDVVSRIEVMNLLRKLAGEGKTILLSTHDTEQAFRMADHLWLLSKEEGLVAGATEDLISEGWIDRYFGRGEIRFDPSEGGFVTGRTDGPPVRIEAAGELLLWASNAMERLGYRVMPENSEQTAYAVIRVSSPGQIEVCRKNARTVVGSFAELSDRFRNDGSTQE